MIIRNLEVLDLRFPTSRTNAGTLVSRWFLGISLRQERSSLETRTTMTQGVIID